MYRSETNLFLNSNLMTPKKNKKNLKYQKYNSQQQSDDKILFNIDKSSIENKTIINKPRQ